MVIQIQLQKRDREGKRRRRTGEIEEILQSFDKINKK